MTTSLFSSFNPVTSTSIYPLWTIFPLIALSIPKIYWTLNPKSMIPPNIIMKEFTKQMKNMMSTSQKVNMALMTALFTTIMIMNLSSLFPFNFPLTSQPQTTLSLAMPLWVSIMTKKLTKPMKVMSHMLPPSTPQPLMPLMIMIETTSTLIQPLTLSIRLMANITAGHILMTLIASSYKTTFTTPIIMLQSMFTTLEIGVSLIQAYVFSMLMTMYMK